MKQKSLMWGALVAIAFASCTQEEVLNNGFGTKTLSVSFEDASYKGSRVGFADQTAAFHWTKGDKIGVTTTASSTTFQGMTLEGNGGEAKGTFSGTFNGDASGYAVYPYGVSGRHSVTSEGALTYTLPAEYTYSTLDTEYAKADGNSHNAPMWGSIAHGAVSFKHLGGVIAFSVGNLPANTADMTFVLTATNQISGSFTATLTESEPVIASASTNVADADKKVTIHFSTVEGQTSGYFYVPVPTGSLGNLSLVILNDQEEVATGAWDNITIFRKDIKRATLGNQSIIGGNGEIKQVASVSNVDAALLSTTEDDLTVQVSGEVTGTDNTITIPATLETNTTTFSFSSVADGAKITIVNATGGAYDGQIIIEIPEGETLPKVVATIPDGEVYIKQGTVTTLVVSSASNTTIIGANAKIGTLTVEKGNVRIEDGGQVSTIYRSENNQETVYAIYESETAPSITLGKGILLVSAAEFDLLTAVANGGEVVLTSDVVLTTPLVIANGKTVSIDLNGFTVSQTKECTASYSMIDNAGTLTIKDTSSEDDGKICFQDLSTGGGSEWGSYVITNKGTLVIENGTLKHLGSANPDAHNTNLPIQNYAGKVTVNGGVISSKDFRSLRDFTAGGEIVINGGVFEGQVWMQGLGNGSSSLTIKGGEFSPLADYDASSIYITNGTNNVIVSIEGGKFNTKIGCVDATKTGIKGSIKGGIFTETAKTNTNSALIAEGYVFEQNSDGSYSPVPAFVKVSDNEYEIYNLAGLKMFSNAVNTGNNYFADQTVVLINDIDLNNEKWTPIGSAAKDHGFMGNFDGNNKTIKNLYISDIALDEDGYAYAGLFGVTEGTDANNENYIKDLIIENVTISTEGHIVAAAIAYPYYTTIENITVEGNIKIKGGDYTAGVLAYTRRCVNANNLTVEGNTGSSIEGRYTVGGVISDIQMNGGLTANYSNFKASGLTITAEKNVGGISGIISGQTLDGAIVENVTIACEGVTKGTVSGALGTTSTIKNIVVTNVTGAENVVGAGYDTGDNVIVNGDVYEIKK